MCTHRNIPYLLVPVSLRDLLGSISGRVLTRPWMLFCSQRGYQYQAAADLSFGQLQRPANSSASPDIHQTCHQSPDSDPILARHAAHTTGKPQQWQTGAPYPHGSCLCAHSSAGPTNAAAITARTQHWRAMLLRLSEPQTWGADGIHADAQNDHEQRR